MSLGERLRQIRREARLTQAELAERARVSQQTVSKLESGRARSTKELVAIARALGVTADYLYGVDTSAVWKERGMRPVISEYVLRDASDEEIPSLGQVVSIVIQGVEQKFQVIGLEMEAIALGGLDVPPITGGDITVKVVPVQ